MPGVRAALCADGETVRGARLWSDANIPYMSLHRISPEVAREILDAWFLTCDTDPLRKKNIDTVKELDRPMLKRG